MSTRDHEGVLYDYGQMGYPVFGTGLHRTGPKMSKVTTLQCQTPSGSCRPAGGSEVCSPNE